MSTLLPRTQASPEASVMRIQVISHQAKGEVRYTGVSNGFLLSRQQDVHVSGKREHLETRVTTAKSWPYRSRCSRCSGFAYTGKPEHLAIFLPLRISRQSSSMTMCDDDRSIAAPSPCTPMIMIMIAFPRAAKRNPGQ